MRFMIFVPGRPKGKERARAGVGKNGKAFMYTPRGTINTEAVIRARALDWMAQNGIPCPHEGPVRIRVRNLYARPKEWWEGKVPMGGCGDVDNLMKVAMDALNKVLFKDDAQIIQGTADKAYHDRPGMLIIAELLPLVEKPKKRKKKDG